MIDTSTAAEAAPAEPANVPDVTRRPARFTRALRSPWPAVVLLLLVVLIALFGPLLSPYGEFNGDLSTRLVPPFGSDVNGNFHLFGTDAVGRDVATRLLYGTRVSLLVGLVGVAIACAIGTSIGLISGVLGSIVDSMLMRFTDVALAIPGLLVAVLVASIFTPSLLTIFGSIGVLLWPVYARMVRAEVLVLKTADFVDLGRVAGCSTRAIVFRHLVPNVLPTVLVLATLQVGAAILLEASISFLGVGLPPNRATLGAMVDAGRPYLASEWWLCALPGFTIFLVVLAFNALGDWARIRFDPRLDQAQ